MTQTPDTQLQRIRSFFTPLKTGLLLTASTFCIGTAMCGGLAERIYQNSQTKEPAKPENPSDIIASHCPVGADRMALNEKGFTPIVIGAPHMIVGDNGGTLIIRNENGQIVADDNGPLKPSNTRHNPLELFISQQGHATGLGYYADDKGCMIVYDTTPEE